MNISTLMKTAIASVLAIAVAGPAAAEVRELGTYVTTKTTKVQVKPQSCKSTKVEFPSATLAFFANSLGIVGGFAESGVYSLTGFVWGTITDIDGNYIERKVGKDLTASMTGVSLGNCTSAGDPLIQTCTGIAEAIQIALVAKECGLMGDEQSDALEVTKGQIKLTKDGAQAKVNFTVEGIYGVDSKDVKVTIKGSKFEWIPAGP